MFHPHLWKRCSVLAGSLLLAASGGYQIQAQPGFQNSDDVKVFELKPVEKFIPCMQAYPNVTPTVRVIVRRGDLNDLMIVNMNGFKRGLKFDLFTVQRNAAPFGLAWYQTDLEANSSTTIKTILVDQIFGFDPDVNLPPTKTFHVGFWFNNPEDAKACGFTGFTPFNGENKAGPLAFISVSDPKTGLGPLCLKPNTSTNPPTCNP